MSIFAYLSGGRFRSSSWLRERLEEDGLRRREERVDLGIGNARPLDGGRTVTPAEYDAVLRAHCRIEK